MFQVIKQILILHNDNLSKYTIQFLNDENTCVKKYLTLG